jgi:ubiquinone/menaquinone biosynthesis C-methylase UbiE
MLHIAPEQCFHERFKKLRNIEYITGDLESPLADHHFDLHDIPFDDNSFDVIMCNHVLEHVNDYHRCASELFRVLKPGGWAIMQVPIDYCRPTTFEDPSITSARDREKYYWQKDHLRLFGRDYPNELVKSGFKIVSNDFVSTLPAEQVQKYRLQPGEILYVAGK